MFEEPLAYDWLGNLVRAEFYEGPIDVSAMNPPGPSDVESGETVVFVWFAVEGYASGWWMYEEDFQEYAEPVGIGALRREGVE